MAGNGDGDVEGFEHAIDVEAALLEAGALSEQEQGEECAADLTLSAEFERAFEDRIGAFETDEATREALLAVLEVPPAEVTFEKFGDAFRVHRDGRALGTWESRPAFLADVAGAQLLADRVEGWESSSVRKRGQLLDGLRLFLTRCPGCSGPLSFTTETVESCCSTREVAAVTCEDCTAGVFESNGIA